MRIDGKDIQNQIDLIQRGLPEIMKVKGYTNDYFTYNKGVVRDSDTIELMMISHGLSYSEVVNEISLAIIELSL